mmetsp:Transcript_98814/g.285184  ORF Transcript_98814/g.285184 Transcript_98814/m.285184 type:complete len:216 (+) Transcript_98814:129-776(+)
MAHTHWRTPTSKKRRAASARASWGEDPHTTVGRFRAAPLTADGGIAWHRGKSQPEYGKYSPAFPRKISAGVVLGGLVTMQRLVPSHGLEGAGVVVKENRGAAAVPYRSADQLLNLGVRHRRPCLIGRGRPPLLIDSCAVAQFHRGGAPPDEAAMRDDHDARAEIGRGAQRLHAPHDQRLAALALGKALGKFAPLPCFEHRLLGGLDIRVEGLQAG